MLDISYERLGDLPSGLAHAHLLHLVSIFEHAIIDSLADELAVRIQLCAPNHVHVSVCLQEHVSVAHSFSDLDGMLDGVKVRQRHAIVKRLRKHFSLAVEHVQRHRLAFPRHRIVAILSLAVAYAVDRAIAESKHEREPLRVAVRFYISQCLACKHALAYR